MGNPKVKWNLIWYIMRFYEIWDCMRTYSRIWWDMHMIYHQQLWSIAMQEEPKLEVPWGHVWRVKFILPPASVLLCLKSIDIPIFGFWGTLFPGNHQIDFYWGLLNLYERFSYSKIFNLLYIYWIYMNMDSQRFTDRNMFRLSQPRLTNKKEGWV